MVGKIYVKVAYDESLNKQLGEMIMGIMPAQIIDTPENADTLFIVDTIDVEDEDRLDKKHGGMVDVIWDTNYDAYKIIVKTRVPLSLSDLADLAAAIDDLWIKRHLKYIVINETDKTILGPVWTALTKYGWTETDSKDNGFRIILKHKENLPQDVVISNLSFNERITVEAIVNSAALDDKDKVKFIVSEIEKYYHNVTYSILESYMADYMYSERLSDIATLKREALPKKTEELEEEDNKIVATLEGFSGTNDEDIKVKEASVHIQSEKVQVHAGEKTLDVAGEEVKAAGSNRVEDVTIEKHQNSEAEASAVIVDRNDDTVQSKIITQTVNNNIQSAELHQHTAEPTLIIDENIAPNKPNTETTQKKQEVLDILTGGSKKKEETLPASESKQENAEPKNDEYNEQITLPDIEEEESTKESETVAETKEKTDSITKEEKKPMPVEEIKTKEENISPDEEKLMAEIEHSVAIDFLEKFADEIAGIIYVMDGNDEKVCYDLPEQPIVFAVEEMPEWAIELIGEYGLYIEGTIPHKIKGQGYLLVKLTDLNNWIEHENIYYISKHPLINAFIRNKKVKAEENSKTSGKKKKSKK